MANSYWRGTSKGFNRSCFIHCFSFCLKNHTGKDRWRSAIPISIGLSWLPTNRHRTWDLRHLLSPPCKRPVLLHWLSKTFEQLHFSPWWKCKVLHNCTRIVRLAEIPIEYLSQWKLEKWSKLVLSKCCTLDVPSNVPTMDLNHGNLLAICFFFGRCQHPRDIVIVEILR